jgi:two-component system sensor histidine kinase QseC
MISIRKRLILTLCTGLGLLLLLGMGTLYFGLRHIIIEQFDGTLMAVMHDLESDLRSGDRPSVDQGPPGPREARRERRMPQPFFYQVYDVRGGLLFSDGIADQALFSTLGGRPGPPRIGQITLPDGSPGRAVAIAVRGAHGSGPLQLVVAADGRGLEHVLGMVLIGVTGVGVSLLIVTIVIVLAGVRRGLRPLETLASEAATIDAASLNRRFALDRLPAELRPIAARLNDLLARLESSFARERRVNADLAHELRTPLAELRILAETAIKWPESREPNLDRDVLDIATHMEQLIGRMLLIARGEEGRLSEAKEPVDVASLLEDIWRHFAPRAAAHRLTARIELSPLTVSSDPVLLRSVLTNLVENAVDYATEGGTLSISCGEEPGYGAVIVVENTASDLTAVDVSRMFERFWRKDAARSNTPHFGLGLALTQRFCEALGWRITAEMRTPGTLTMTVRGDACCK